MGTPFAWATGSPRQRLSAYPSSKVTTQRRLREGRDIMSRVEGSKFTLQFLEMRREVVRANTHAEGIGDIFGYAVVSKDQRSGAVHRNGSLQILTGPGLVPPATGSIRARGTTARPALGPAQEECGA